MLQVVAYTLALVGSRDVGDDVKAAVAAALDSVLPYALIARFVTLRPSQRRVELEVGTAGGLGTYCLGGYDIPYAPRFSDLRTS